jgi:hypothetical protein
MTFILYPSLPHDSISVITAFHHVGTALSQAPKDTKTPKAMSSRRTRMDPSLAEKKVPRWQVHDSSPGSVSITLYFSIIHQLAEEKE